PRVFYDEGRSVWMIGCEEVTPQPITFTFVAGVDLYNLPEMHRAGYAAARPGGWDPNARLEDMVTDGVSAEVLYPSLGLGLYWIDKTENDPFWAAAQEMDMPVALHILTDHGITKWRVETRPTGFMRYRSPTFLGHEIELSIFDLIFSGVLERFPELQLISVENE